MHECSMLQLSLLAQDNYCITMLQPETSNSHTHHGTYHYHETVTPTSAAHIAGGLGVLGDLCRSPPANSPGRYSSSSTACSAPACTTGCSSESRQGPQQSACVQRTTWSECHGRPPTSCLGCTGDGARIFDHSISSTSAHLCHAVLHDTSTIRIKITCMSCSFLPGCLLSNRFCSAVCLLSTPPVSPLTLQTPVPSAVLGLTWAGRSILLAVPGGYQALTPLTQQQLQQHPAGSSSSGVSYQLTVLADHLHDMRTMLGCVADLGLALMLWEENMVLVTDANGEQESWLNLAYGVKLLMLV